MFNNYLKIAFRNIWRHKLFSAINIISLAIGISASFVIGLMVYFDLSFDKFHSESDKIYRITSDFISNEDESHNPGVPVALMQEVKDNFTGIVSSGSLYTIDFLDVENTLSKKIFKSPEYTALADPDFFEIIKYEWLHGNPHSSLREPNSVVLTEDRAGKYFPSMKLEDVVGQTLVYNDSIQTKITGIISNFKERSDFKIQEYLSVGTSVKTHLGNSIKEPQWGSTNSSNQFFIKVADKNAIKNISKRLDELALEHRSEYDIKFNRKRGFTLQPLADLHFNQDYGLFNFSGRPANKSVMIGLGFIAVFLLILGCINFINLNTAQASQRAKEIGIRKTLGSSKKQLVFQFLGETFILTLLAASISILLAKWLLNVFADFTPEGLEFSLFKDPLIIGFSVLLLFIITLLAGLYPSFVLSKFKPVSVLKNQVLDKQSKPTLRRFLTVFQFSIAQIFIIATILVGKQINFMLTKDMGFKTDAIAYFYTPWHVKSFDNKLRLKEELKKIPQINKVVLAGNPPASNNMSSSEVSVFRDGREIQSPIQFLSGDSEYIDIYGMEMLAGRPPLNDTIKEFVINETYMKIIGIEDPKDALDVNIEYSDIKYPIVGVVKDFNQRSLKLPIEPMAIRGDWNREKWSGFGTIHLNFGKNEDGKLSSTIAKVEDIYKSIYPDTDFELNFMDESVQSFYKQEKSLSKLLNWAMGLSLLISCLGLLGLVIYTTERRTKEIGIRKVLGASISQLNLLLCKDFLTLVGIAFVIAVPIAYWLLKDWLKDFAFRTELSWWVFVLSGVGMIAIALIIMSARTIRTAMRNPVNSLRTE